MLLLTPQGSGAHDTHIGYSGPGLRFVSYQERHKCFLEGDTLMFFMYATLQIPYVI